MVSAEWSGAFGLRVLGALALVALAGFGALGAVPGPASGLPTELAGGSGASGAAVDARTAPSGAKERAAARGLQDTGLAQAAGKAGAGPSADATALDEETAPLDATALLEALRTRHELPALAAVVVTRDGVWAEGYAGVAERGTERPVGPESRFHLGSCTKAMTATLAALAVERGELAWDTTLGEVFGERLELPVWHGVTLAQLLAHTSGAPRDLLAFPGVDLWLRFAEDSLRDKRLRVVELVGAREPDYPPGSEARYSNVGYMLAGAMLEARADEGYEELLTARLFAPLGMDSAGFGPPDPEAHPVGHTQGGSPRPSLDNPAALGPAGTAHASLRDWGKFVQLHLLGLGPGAEQGDLGTAAGAGERADGTSQGGAAAPDPTTPDAELLLPPVRFAELHTVQPNTDALGGYALGWLKADLAWSAGPLSTHAGSNTVWFCTVWLAPAEGFAVLVATNQAHASASDACTEATALLALGFLDGALPEAAPETLAEVLDLRARFMAPPEEPEEGVDAPMPEAGAPADDR